MQESLPVISIRYPAWVSDRIDWERRYSGDEERMRVAIEVARHNVVEKTGGPFGAAVFESESGRLVSVGMNLVVPNNNSVLHAEVVAFMMAESRIGSYSLGAASGKLHEMATSCEPCAMCLGATLWSGVRRLLCGATRDDAVRINFDEGPVFPQSYAYLRERGIEVVRQVAREEARAVLDLYKQTSGVIYNG
jgi:tRNA(Arg) A34 adenosine deaminase TadA